MRSHAMKIVNAPMFDCENKIAARAFMRQEAEKHLGREPTKIFTLPAAAGFCSIEFREQWEGAEILGLDYTKSIVRDSDLIKRGVVDKFLCGSIRNLLDGDHLSLKKETPFNRLVKCSKKISSHYMGFDFAFLDFCGTAEKFVNDVIDFGQLMAGDGVVGITFFDVNDPVSFLIPHMEILSVHRYKTKSNMILIMAKYPNPLYETDG